jgi:hypothetical protein
VPSALYRAGYGVGARRPARVGVVVETGSGSAAENLHAFGYFLGAGTTPPFRGLRPSTNPGAVHWTIDAVAGYQRIRHTFAVTGPLVEAEEEVARLLGRPGVLRRRSDDRLAEVKRVNDKLAGIAERAARRVDAVARNARRTLRRHGEGASGKAKALVEGLERTAERVRKIAEQTRQRLAGTRRRGRPGWCRCTTATPGPSRRAASANPSSSATRPSSSTTKTASSSTTASRPPGQSDPLPPRPSHGPRNRT